MKTVFALCCWLALGGLAYACEPVWVRTVVPARYTSAFEGRVVNVDWFASKIVVMPLKSLSGPLPGKTEVKFEKWPWECGHQSFRTGEVVDVFSQPPYSSWAHAPEDINFGHGYAGGIGTPK